MGGEVVEEVGCARTAVGEVTWEGGLGVLLLREGGGRTGVVSDQGGGGEGGHAGWWGCHVGRGYK